MKAFEFFNDFGNVEFPNDCKKIWDYLEEHGKINITKRFLDTYYREFSNTHGMGWIDINAGDDWLEAFAIWLSNKDI